MFGRPRSASSLFCVRRVVSGFALALALACGPSTAGETQQWERNVAAVTEFGTAWPGFKTVLEEKQAAAQPAWDEALKVGDEEAKAKAMDAANEQFNPLLGKLREVKSKSEGVRDTITKLNRLKLKKSNKARRADIVDDAEIALDEVEAAMAAAAPADEGAAVALASEQISRLISIAAPVNRMHDKYKTKVKLGRKKKGKK